MNEQDRVERLMRAVADHRMTCNLSLCLNGPVVGPSFRAEIWAPIPDGERESPRSFVAERTSPAAAIVEAFGESLDWLEDQRS